MLGNQSFNGATEALTDERTHDAIFESASSADSSGNSFILLNDGTDVGWLSVDLEIHYDLRTVIVITGQYGAWQNYPYSYEITLARLSPNEDRTDATDAYDFAPSAQDTSMLADLPAGSKGRYLHLEYKFLGKTRQTMIEIMCFQAPRLLPGVSNDF